ncbi:MAG: ribosome maturation factor RimP [Desulfuromonadales bacterium]|nr:ribosome maturation factor RimP [Desulfuromonadales bacterium]
MKVDIQQTLEQLVQPVLDDFGLELVELEYKPEGRSMALRIFIDKPGGVGLDDCVAVSREVEAVLEVEDPVRGAYRLEVSSPGLDRPLKKASDFERFAGKAVKIKTREPLDPDQRGHSRKTFAGRLLGCSDDLVRLEQTDKRGGVVAIALHDIAKANLDLEF